MNKEMSRDELLEYLNGCSLTRSESDISSNVFEPIDWRTSSTNDIYMDIHNQKIQDQMHYATEECKNNINNDNWIFGYIENPHFRLYDNWNMKTVGNMAFIACCYFNSDQNQEDYVRRKCKHFLLEYKKYREQYLLHYSKNCLIM